MDDQESQKLFIMATCSICLGSRRKGVFLNCPYCNSDRKQYIEASFKVLKEILRDTLTSEQKKELAKELKKK